MTGGANNGGKGRPHVLGESVLHHSDPYFQLKKTVTPCCRAKPQATGGSDLEVGFGCHLCCSASLKRLVGCLIEGSLEE